jgi:hypothetical protein
MDAPVYWRTPFKAMLTSRALVEYIVLDIEPLHGAGGGGGGGGYGSSSSGSSGKWSLAEAQVARKSDFGRNDTVFFARTHLGHILHPGKAGSLLDKDNMVANPVARRSGGQYPSGSIRDRKRPCGPCCVASPVSSPRRSSRRRMHRAIPDTEGANR